MRSSIPMTVLAVGTATAISMTSFSAQAQHAVCLPARGCIPTSQEATTRAISSHGSADGGSQTTVALVAASTGSSSCALPAGFQDKPSSGACVRLSSLACASASRDQQHKPKTKHARPERAGHFIHVRPSALLRGNSDMGIATL